MGRILYRLGLTVAIASIAGAVYGGDTINITGDNNTVIIQKITVRGGRGNTHKYDGPTPSAKVVRRSKDCYETRRQHQKTTAEWTGLFSR